MRSSDGPASSSGEPCCRPCGPGQPSPSPSSILPCLPLVLFDRGLDCRRERFPTSSRFAAEGHAEDWKAARRERLKVAQRLRLFEDREAERLPRDRNILGVVLDDLQ